MSNHVKTTVFIVGFADSCFSTWIMTLADNECEWQVIDFTKKIRLNWGWNMSLLDLEWVLDLVKVKVNIKF